MLFTSKKAIALGELSKRCIRMNFSLEVIILEEYSDVSKIQLQHDNGYSVITLTENSNLDTRIPENYF